MVSCFSHSGAAPECSTIVAIFLRDQENMKPSDFLSHNRTAWDRLASKGDRLAKPAREQDLRDPLASVDGPGWLGGDIRGKNVLCLAAGGGRQGPIYAQAGANVTVVDLSPAMLELDRRVAAERGIALRTVEATMERLDALVDESFDIVIHPVSTCYVPDVQPVFQEVARVLRTGGLYISQHKQPISLQTTLKPTVDGYLIEQPYYRESPLPVSREPNLIREDGTLEWIHRWESLLGGMCRAGLAIEDVTEPLHAKPTAAYGTFGHRAQFVAPYIRIKARRVVPQKPPTSYRSGGRLIIES